MNQAPPTARALRYANILNASARRAAAAARNASSTPAAAPIAPAPSGPQSSAGPQPPPGPRPPVIVNLIGGMPANDPDLPWSPAFPAPAPIRSALVDVQSKANTDFTVELPWPLRIIFQWNFLRLYGTTEVTVNPGMEPDFFTGRIYGYIDHQNSNTARTLTRLQAFFNLSTLFYIYRFAVISGILYRIPLTLFRYGLMKWGFMPLFQDDFLWRIFLDLVAVFLGIWFFDFWPLHLMDHVCRVFSAVLLQAAVITYFGNQKKLMDLVFQLHPVVWVSCDVVWTILYHHTELPIPSPSTMWYLAGLDINPYYLVTRLYDPLTRAYRRWKFCGGFGKELQGVCFLTDESDFPRIFQHMSEKLTLTRTLTPKTTEYSKVYFPITTPIIVIEMETKTIFKGPITGPPNLSERITDRTSFVTGVIATIFHTITKTLTGRTSEAPEASLPDSTCEWTYTGTGTIPLPEACSQ